MATRRERQQAELRRDVLDAAARQVDDSGASCLNWRGVARSVGVGPSTLYTYFDGIHGLTTALIVHTYEQLAEAIDAGVTDHDEPADRLLAGARAYRRWALANRGRFNLVFTDIIPGYAAPSGGPTVIAQAMVLEPLVASLGQLLGHDSSDILRWPAPDRHFAIGAWAQLHGLVSLEVNHHLDWTGDAEATFENRLASIVDEASDRP